jgi:hypothetical protein
MKQVIKMIRPEINAALQDVANKYGLEIKCGSGSYGDGHFTLKLEASSKGEDGNVITKEAKAYTRLCQLYGCEPQWLDQKFTSYTGEEYTLIGLNPKAQKFTMLGKRTSDGKVFKFGHGMVEFCFKKSAAA